MTVGHITYEALEKFLRTPACGIFPTSKFVAQSNFQWEKCKSMKKVKIHKHRQFSIPQFRCNFLEDYGYQNVVEIDTIFPTTILYALNGPLGSHMCYIIIHVKWKTQCDWRSQTWNSFVYVCIRVGICSHSTESVGHNLFSIFETHGHTQISTGKAWRISIYYKINLSVTILVLDVPWELQSVCIHIEP